MHDARERFRRSMLSVKTMLLNNQKYVLSEPEVFCATSLLTIRMGWEEAWFVAMATVWRNLKYGAKLTSLSDSHNTVESTVYVRTILARLASRIFPDARQHDCGLNLSHRSHVTKCLSTEHSIIRFLTNGT